MKHKIICGDLTKGDLVSLMGDNKADIIYTDPPWNDTWITTFRKRAGKTDTQSLKDFLQIFVSELKKYSKGVIYIEFGVRINELLDVLEKEGAQTLNLWESPLGKTGKQYLWRGSFSNSFKPITFNKDINKLMEPDVINGGILLDPCIGLGRSYYLAKRAGMICHGLEIQKSKVNKLLTEVKNDE